MCKNVMNMDDKCSQIKKIDLAKTFQLTFVIILSHLSSTQQVSEHTQLFMLGHDKPFDSFDYYQTPKENMTLMAGLHWKY